MASNPLPLYHKVYLLLRQRLATEGDGAPLPGENALAAEYGVSRLTVRRALGVLETEGLIRRVQGRGTFAAGQDQALGTQHGAGIDGLMAHLAKMGMQTHVRLLELTVENAAPAVAQRLGLAVGAQVQRSVRVRSHEAQPFSRLTTYVPQDIGRRIRPQDLDSKPLQAIFRDLGLRVASAEQSITAVLADPAAAAALDVPVGAALLNIHRLVRDDSGRAVEYLDAVYRPDRYAYRMDMRASGTPGAPTWQQVDSTAATR